MTNFSSKDLMVTLRPKKHSSLTDVLAIDDAEFDLYGNEALECAGASCKATNKILACAITNDDDDSNCKATNDTDGTTCKRTNDDDITCKRTNEDDDITCKRTNDEDDGVTCKRTNDDDDSCKATNDDDKCSCKRTNGDDDGDCKTTNDDVYDKKAYRSYNERLKKLKYAVAGLQKQ